jgi:signal transduction histidine kinase
VNWHSLRLRLVAGGIVAILAALSVAGIALVLLFERHVARSVASDLDVHLGQLLAGVDVGADGRLVVLPPPADPRFANPLSGLYWQIGDERAPLLRSRSLWDTVLVLPSDDLPLGAVHHHEAIGPAGARMLIAERRIMLTLPDGPTPLRVAVAVDRARIWATTASFGKDLAIALILLGVVLAIATSVQVTLGLKPLDRLRRSVANIRAGRSRRLPGVVPAEVQPLVAEVNALLDAQDREIERSRGRAADLAHGLKTPLAALMSDANRLRARGEHAIARDIEAVGETMNRHVDRELARARVKGTDLRRHGVSTQLMPIMHSLIGTLLRSLSGASVDFEIVIPENLSLPFDRTDLAEILGNLLDNAARHAKGRVRITARPGSSGMSLIIEDDGSGIPASEWAAALQRGTRLDERGGSSGLGLSIVQDLLDAYGWRMVLSRSDLGGLKVVIAPDDRRSAVA